jgi:hypothetical protein
MYLYKVVGIEGPEYPKVFPGTSVICPAHDYVLIS